MLAESSGTVAVKGFIGIIRAAADFIVVVGKPAAGHAHAKVRVRTQAVDKTELGIEIHRRDGETQSEIGVQEIRLVVIIKGITGKRRMTFQGLIVAELKQVAPDRVKLCGNEIRGNSNNHNSSLPVRFIMPS